MGGPKSAGRGETATTFAVNTYCIFFLLFNHSQFSTKRDKENPKTRSRDEEEDVLFSYDSMLDYSLCEFSSGVLPLGCICTKL